jgi:hypothetical protein
MIFPSEDHAVCTEEPIGTSLMPVFRGTLILERSAYQCTG